MYTIDEQHQRATLQGSAHRCARRGWHCIRHGRRRVLWFLVGAATSTLCIKSHEARDWKKARRYWHHDSTPLVERPPVPGSMPRAKGGGHPSWMDLSEAALDSLLGTVQGFKESLRECRAEHERKMKRIHELHDERAKALEEWRIRAQEQMSGQWKQCTDTAAKKSRCWFCS